MTVQYFRLEYEQYKALEEACLDFKGRETTHKSHDGFYHCSFRVQLTDDLIIEFHGPLVMAAEEEMHNPMEHMCSFLGCGVSGLLYGDGQSKLWCRDHFPGGLPGGQQPKRPILGKSVLDELSDEAKLKRMKTEEMWGWIEQHMGVKLEPWQKAQIEGTLDRC